MSISLTLAKVQGYKLTHPREFRNMSYLPSIPDLLRLTEEYFKEEKRYNSIREKLKRDNANSSEIRKLKNGHNEKMKLLELML